MEIGRKKDGVVISDPVAPLLHADGVAFGYNGQPLIQDLSVQINKGDLYQIKGPNGSGKTTLLKILAGLLPPISGQVNHYAFVKFLSYQGWQSDHLTVAETLDFWSKFYRACAQKALKDFQFQPLLNKKVHTLSQGQKQRLALARLTLGAGGVWLLDEPTLSLDDYWVHYIYDILQIHLNQGGAAVIATHDPLPIPANSLEIHHDYSVS